MTPNTSIRHGASGLRARFAVVGIVAGLLTAALGSPGTAHAGTPVYPDLRVLGPTAMQFWKADITGTGQPEHYYMLLTTRIWNAGAGAFELNRTLQPSLISDLSQRIYEQPVGFRDERIGSIALEGTPFKAPDITRVEVWTKRGYNRAARSGFKRGRPQFSQYMSYCLSDQEQVDPNALQGTYVCTTLRQGISPGWSQVEQSGDTSEWIDFGVNPLPDGEYVVRAIADPNDIYLESAGHADASRESEVANSGIAYFRVINGQLAGVE